MSHHEQHELIAPSHLAGNALTAGEFGLGLTVHRAQAAAWIDVVVSG